MTELLDDEENEVKNLAIEAFFKNINRFTDKKVEDSCIEIIIDLINTDSNSDLITE